MKDKPQSTRLASTKGTTKSPTSVIGRTFQIVLAIVLGYVILNVLWMIYAWIALSIHPLSF